MRRLYRGAVQRRPPKHPRRPSSQQLGPRQTHRASDPILRHTFLAEPWNPHSGVTMTVYAVPQEVPRGTS